MALRSDDPRSPSRQIVDELRRKIAMGQLKAGDQLPSNAEMRATYDVSNQTAQNAISALKNDGLVYSVSGRGVFVRSDFDQDELLQRVTGGDGESELYGELLSRLTKIDDEQSRLSGQLAEIKERVEAIEGRQGVDGPSLGQSSLAPDR